MWTQTANVLVGTSMLVAGGLWIRAGDDADVAEVSQADAATDSALLIDFGLQGSEESLVSRASVNGSPDSDTVTETIKLQVEKRDAVEFTETAIRFTGPTVVRTASAAESLTSAIKASEAISIEVVFRAAADDQSGPARIVTLSESPNARNFTIGQDGNRIEVRLRTTSTSTNGTPALVSRPLDEITGWQHVVYTRDVRGRARIYVNGELNAEGTVPGSLDNWDSKFPFAIGNELTGDRPWRGEIGLVRVFSRVLSPGEIADGRQVVDGEFIGVDTEWLAAQERALRFELQVAPLLARHCLECHDAAIASGGLDLSSRELAVTGGDSGPAIDLDHPAESLVWNLVQVDDMPKDRPALSREEKQLLRNWLDDGAHWTLASIDPAVYIHSDDAQSIFVQRLTVPEYVATVESVFGIDVAGEAQEHLPRDVRADGFSNTAYNLTVDLEHVEAYAELAQLIVKRLDLRKLAERYTRTRELTDENITKVIQPIGTKLFRGPLSDEELALYCGISTTVAGSGGDFDESVAFIFEAMLQSPRFLYRIENQRGYGQLNQFELAARISYIVWGAPPDQELLNTAEQGKLTLPGIDGQLDRMFGDPRAKQRSRLFIQDWLNLGRLDNLKPDAERFPNWRSELAGDMREETLQFFDEAAWNQKLPLTSLIDAQFTFLTPRLAEHYGIAVAASHNSGEFRMYDLSEIPERGGLLTQGSVLTVGGDEASMVARGLFVMHELLRGVVHDPPPCVDTSPVETKPGISQRAISEQRLRNQACAGCHQRFEPLAFGFERFDGLGAFHRQDEHGNELREDGTITIPGRRGVIDYANSEELASHLAESDRIRQTLTWKLAQFSLGRPLGAADAAAMDQVVQEGWNAGGTYQDLLRAIVLSDLVRLARTEPETLE